MTALVPQQILDCARRRPDATAVRSEGDHLSYGELDVRSDLVARSLLAQGVQRGQVVGVSLERTPWLIATLLGIWRAGAAYLPLDPADPSARRHMLLTDAGAELVLTEPPGGAAADGPAAHSTVPTDLAYVIFTSGSTGRPKGVAVPHGCVAAMFEAMSRHVAAGPGDVWLSVTSAGFDISVFEFFWTLTRGMTVELADTSAPRLFDTALASETHDITHLQATPTLLNALSMDPATWRGFGRLRHLTATGEALPAELARSLRDAVPGAFINAYGPTETTVWASVEDAPVSADGVVTIGRPLDGQDIHILDEAGVAVADGTVGELYIGGSGVSLGYIGRAGLTAARFVPDPWAETPGAHMYRTGDIGRRLPDGRIVCLGRNDRQVKVRGHRVELDEIEHALLALPSVSAGAVLVEGSALAEGLIDPRIVAVVQGDPEEPDAARSIRVTLAERLPAAAVPAEVRFVAEIPRTTSGKVDRRSIGDTSTGVDNPTQHVVAVNDSGRHGLWWPDLALPAGWRHAGFGATQDECISWVDEQPN